jgi:hypothetical protein
VTPEIAPLALVATLVIYVVASLGLVPFVAVEKRRSGFLWMLVALACSPLLALVALVALPTGDHGDPASPFEAELRSR